MPDVTGRRRAVAAAIVVAGLVTSIVPAVTAVAATPAGLEPFLYALGKIESGGSYTARNATTGAYGKYQILPSNWPTWAKLYIGSSTAPQTPANQETVAHRKVSALYVWLDTWPAVAHWWLTGSSERNPAYWSSYSRTYVDRIIAMMKGSADATATVSTKSSWLTGTTRRIGDASSSIAYSTGWKAASYQTYTNHRVKYATRTGASATLTFTGKGVAWYGPVGPTRGKARVYLDGRAVATIDLRRSDFDARRLLFARSFTAGQHTLKIVVISSGRPVAIDDFRVGI